MRKAPAFLFIAILLLLPYEAQGREAALPLPQDAAVDVAGKPGGRLITALLADPKTFNPVVYSDETSQMLSQLTAAGLTEIDRIAQQPVPALAQSWDVSKDQLGWTFHLRRGVQWSDGRPLTADDVLFTMQVVMDPNIPSGAQDAMIPGIRWSKIDDYTVTARMPEIFAPFLRQLDGETVPILPRHVWEPIYRQGKVEQSMGVDMDLRNFVCAGPFTISAYSPGRQLTLSRNPYYWKKDRAGNRLPYLDQIVFLILPTIDQIYLKIEDGELDTFYTIRPENVEELTGKSSAIGMRVVKVGPSLDSEGLWFNLNPGRNPKTGKPYVDPVKRAWFEDARFRNAVSCAINREALVQNALFSHGVPAYGPETPGNRLWYSDNLARCPYNPARALELLRSAGFTRKTAPDGTVKLLDKAGTEVRFSLNTNAGNSVRATECQMIAADLAKLGMNVEFTALDYNTLVSRIQDNFEYDAMLLGITHDDPDPSSGSNTWPSKGTLHLWWPAQKKPATPWEQRIDELMELQSRTYDFAQRKKYYDDVQRIVSEQLPVIFTTTQMIYVCAKEKLGNFKPSISKPRTLWNAEELYWK